MNDVRRHAPAAARNREPILQVLRRLLPAAGRVLEIASGSGEHAVWFARHLPGLTWLPSDPGEDACASIEAWRSHAGVANIAPVRQLDATAADWPLSAEERPVDAVVCINMVHIAPWSACLGLLAGAARATKDGGLLFLYGPFLQAGRETAPGNLAFDASLRAQNPEWGLRTVADVEAAAGAAGFTLAEIVEMPANNLSLVFRRH